MPEIPSKEYKQYVKFLCDLSKWTESLENDAWAPWKKSNGKSVNYKHYRDTLQKFTLLQSRLPTLTPRRIFVRDKRIETIVRELKNLSDNLSSQACRLIEEDKAYLFNPLVQVTILFHIRNRDFLESLSEAIRHKSKAAKHGNKRSLLVFSTAFLLSQEPRTKPSHIYKVLEKVLDKYPARRSVIGDKDWHRDSIQKLFKRNKAEIFALRDLLTYNPT
jgi:CRISPR/Cas system CSM-associated protein Csm2 small subunit